MRKILGGCLALLAITSVAGCGDPVVTVDDASVDARAPVDAPMRADAPDECAGRDLCTTEGVTCDDDELVACAEDADGCLVETRTDCATTDEVCDDTLATPACVDPCADIAPADTCLAAGRTCSGETLEICTMRADGCFEVVRTVCDATAGGVCDDGGEMPMCIAPPDPCAGIADACATAGTSCDAEELVTCAPNAFGCLVATRTDCTDRASGVCDETAATPVCTFTGDPCAGVTECDPAGAVCDGPELVVCAEDAFGCMVETTTDCTAAMFGFCEVDAAGDDSCSTAASDPCMGVTECGTAESRTCAATGEVLTVCEANAFGCFVATETNCATTSEVCDAPAAGPATCVDPCSLVDECATATSCEANTLVTCTADTNGCLVESSRTACAGMCATSGGSSSCVDTICPEAGMRVLDCASGTVTGTTNPGSDVRNGPYTGCTTSTSYTGPEEIWRFRHAGTGPVQVTIASMSASAEDMDLFVLEGGDGTGTCAAASCTTGSRGASADERVVFRGTPGETEYVVYDVFADATATADYSLMVTCAPIVCGDGILMVGETCEDSDAVGGDGCSATCTIEPGFVCYGTPPTVCGPVNTCGNGFTEGTETCDDGNMGSGDGCSSSCATEPGYGCTTARPAVCTLLCGNGVVNAGETCDDMDRDSGDGCSSTCTVESGFTCSGAPSFCVMTAPNATCAMATAVGATTTITAEDTREGGASPTGTTCGSAGSPTLYYSVTIPAGQRVVIVMTPTGFDAVLKTEDTCGAAACNARVDVGFSGDPETTVISNTGLLPITRIVAANGFSSTGGGGVYNISFTYGPAGCGNGALDGTEACDDGDNDPGDGCSATCTVEPTYNCFGAPSMCVVQLAHATCAGARAVTGTETITGEDARRGGASPTGTSCGTPAGTAGLYYSLTIPAGASVVVRAAPTGTPAWDLEIVRTDACGAAACTGVTDSAGDGGAETSPAITNTTAGPITRIVIVRDDAPSTPGTYDVTFTYQRCGNGVLEGAEQCDDNGAIAGDGCSATCTVETTYTCTGVPSTCTAAAGYARTTLAASCVDMTAGTAVAGVTADDSVSAITAIGMPFTFWRAPVTHYSVSSNGFVQLYPSATGTAVSTFTNQNMPSTTTPNGVVAAFWDDLRPNVGATVRTLTTGVAGSRRFVVEWANWRASGTGTESLTFQAHLIEGTNTIEYHYCTMTAGLAGTVHTGSSATIGTENQTGTAASQQSFNTADAVMTGSGFLFTPM